MRIEAMVRPRRRDGSLAIEGLFTLPVVAVVILLVRFVFEGAMTRHEVSVHTRGSAVAAGAADSALPTVCRHDGAFTARDGVSKSFRVACDTRDAEAGLRRERPIIEALREGAGDWPELVAPFEDAMPVRDYRAVGAGATRFDSPPFLTQQGTIDSDAAYLSPSLQVFDQSREPWRSGHDAVIREELGDGPQRLFPNLFPSK